MIETTVFILLTIWMFSGFTLYFLYAPMLTTSALLCMKYGPFSYFYIKSKNEQLKNEMDEIVNNQTTTGLQGLLGQAHNNIYSQSTANNIGALNVYGQGTANNIGAAMGSLSTYGTMNTKTTTNFKLEDDMYTLGSIKLFTLKKIQGIVNNGSGLSIIINGCQLVVYVAGIFGDLKQEEKDLINFIKRAEHTKNMQNNFDKLIGE